MRIKKIKTVLEIPYWIAFILYSLIYIELLLIGLLPEYIFEILRTAYKYPQILSDLRIDWILFLYLNMLILVPVTFKPLKKTLKLRLKHPFRWGSISSFDEILIA